MLIAQISDTHVEVQGEGRANAADSQTAFDALIESLSAQFIKPDLILFSGDLGERAEDGEYARVASGLAGLDVPVLAVPGNHDMRAPMKKALGAMVGEIPSGHLCVCEDSFPLVVIGLDTLTEGAPHGELCAERLDWFSGKLAHYCNRDVLIFMHHPPFRTGMQHMDSIGLLKGQAEFGDMVRSHGRVQAILCGHVHRAITGSCGGVPVHICPSAFRQLAFDLRDGEPYRFTDEPSQHMMHLYQPGNGLVSHVVPIGTR